MKLLLLVLSIMLSVNNVVLAGEGKQENKQKFDQVKVRILQNLTMRIEIINTFKSCVEQAKTWPELKICKEDKKSAMQALKMRHQQARE